MDTKSMLKDLERKVEENSKRWEEIKKLTNQIEALNDDNSELVIKPLVKLVLLLTEQLEPISNTDNIMKDLGSMFGNKQ